MAKKKIMNKKFIFKIVKLPNHLTLEVYIRKKKIYK